MFRVYLARCFSGSLVGSGFISGWFRDYFYRLIYMMFVKDYKSGV